MTRDERYAARLACEALRRGQVIDRAGCVPVPAAELDRVLRVYGECDRLDALLAKYGIDPQTGEPTPCLTTT
jgi:hypothetical protein